MRTTVIGILMASYLNLSYKVKRFGAMADGMAIELLITCTLVLFVIIPAKSEFFVWMLVSLLAVQQVIQLVSEAKERRRKQKQAEETDQIFEQAA